MWKKKNQNRLPPRSDVRLRVRETCAVAHPRQTGQKCTPAEMVARCALLLVIGVFAACASTPSGTAVAQQAPHAASAIPAAQQVPQSREQIRLSFAPVVRQAAPAVVNIYTTKQGVRSPLESLFSDPFFDQFFDRRHRRAPSEPLQQALGSGVIVREDGLIITNHHVIEDSDQIMVVLSDRREYRAKVLGDDQTADLALLHIDVGDEHLPTLPIGDSDQLEVGDLVLAIGNPFGIGKTVTSGIVSALARTTPEIGADLSFIQTDAAINPGNSGGALVTLDGRLVGINTAIFTQSGGSIGIGFAIPVNLVKALIRSIDSGSKLLARAWLGAKTQPVDADLASTLGLVRPGGVLVNQIYPHGPAARAGLTLGDVVLAVDGNEVVDPHGLNFRLAVGQVGHNVNLDVWRDGKRISMKLALETPPYDPPPGTMTLTGHHALSGARVANMSPGLNEELGFDLFERGVVVVGIEDGSDAERLQFRRGDVITQLAGERIDNVDHLNQVVHERSLPWQLEVDRGGRRLAVVIH
jgi:Do/DeqQ family serine protease